MYMYVNFLNIWLVVVLLFKIVLYFMEPCETVHTTCITLELPPDRRLERLLPSTAILQGKMPQFKHDYIFYYII